MLMDVVAKSSFQEQIRWSKVKLHPHCAALRLTSSAYPMHLPYRMSPPISSLRIVHCTFFSNNFNVMTTSEVSHHLNFPTHYRWFALRLHDNAFVTQSNTFCALVSPSTKNDTLLISEAATAKKSSVFLRFPSGRYVILVANETTHCFHHMHLLMFIHYFVVLLERHQLKRLLTLRTFAMSSSISQSASLLANFIGMSNSLCVALHRVDVTNFDEYHLVPSIDHLRTDINRFRDTDNSEHCLTKRTMSMTSAPVAVLWTTFVFMSLVSIIGHSVQISGAWKTVQRQCEYPLSQCGRQRLHSGERSSHYCTVVEASDEELPGIGSSKLFTCLLLVGTRVVAADVSLFTIFPTCGFLSFHHDCRMLTCHLSSCRSLHGAPAALQSFLNLPIHETLPGIVLRVIVVLAVLRHFTSTRQCPPGLHERLWSTDLEHLIFEDVTVCRKWTVQQLMLFRDTFKQFVAKRCSLSYESTWSQRSVARTARRHARRGQILLRHHPRSSSSNAVDIISPMNKLTIQQ